MDLQSQGVHNGIILVEFAWMLKEYSLTTTLPPRLSQLVNYWHTSADGLSISLSIHYGIILVELAAILCKFKEYSLTTTLPPRLSQLVNYWHTSADGLSKS